MTRVMEISFRMSWTGWGLVGVDWRGLGGGRTAGGAAKGDGYALLAGAIAYVALTEAVSNGLRGWGEDELGCL